MTITDIGHDSLISLELTKIETQALTEQAFWKLELDISRVKSLSWQCGESLFRISASRLTSYNNRLVSDILTMFEDAPELASAFYAFRDEHTEQERISVLDRTLFDIELASRTKEMAYLSNLDREVYDASVALSSALDLLGSIQKYQDLLQLEKTTLQRLVTLEQAKVERAEAMNIYIDAFTSGHHRDMLVLYEHALAGVSNPGTGFLFMDDDGNLAFNPADDVEACKL